MTYCLLAQADVPTGVGDTVERLLGSFLSWPGLVIAVLSAGLVVLRVYYALRSAINVRADDRLGPPRGLLSGYFARLRLERLVASGRFVEAADLLQAWDPTRAVEAAELYVKGRKYARAAQILIANNRLRRAAEAYVRAGSYDLAAELYERAEELGAAEENYLRAGNKFAAARMLARAGKPERAARYFADAKHPREAAEQLEKAGKTREAVEKYVEALALLERAGFYEPNTNRRERLFRQDRVQDQLCDKILGLYEKLGDLDSQVELLLERARPEEAAQVLRKTGKLTEAAEVLVRHDLVEQANQVLDEAGAGNTTRRRILQQPRALPA